MKPDGRIDRIQRATLAASARQYLKESVREAIETGLSALEAELSAKEISVQRTLVTLGGIMAMRRLSRSLDRDIHKGEEAATPPRPV